MKCQFCGRPATIHLTDLIQKKKREMHLCEDCARAQNLLPDPPGPQLNLQALVELMLGQPAPADSGGLLCPSCGLQYAVFRADGRLGCPDDYDSFRPALESLIERIHRSTAHEGKVPRAAGRRAELESLRADLADAVAAEQFEQAATLRDRIRQKEGVDEPG